MKDFYRQRKTYYGRFKNWEIKAKDIDESKIFWVRNYKYIKTTNNYDSMKYSLFNNKKWCD